MLLTSFYYARELEHASTMPELQRVSSSIMQKFLVEPCPFLCMIHRYWCYFSFVFHVVRTELRAKPGTVALSGEQRHSGPKPALALHCHLSKCAFVLAKCCFQS
jgi:hypothetical protein